MHIRPRVGIGIEPFFVRSAVHAALARDSRIDAFLLPADPNAQLQARDVDADALVMSHATSRTGLPVLVLFPDGSVEAFFGAAWRRAQTTGIPELADLIVEEVERAQARRRHPAMARPA
ncbi:MAG: hypothetical protein LC722_04945 [Actinobacteria bacterium]|nr:hypothetical protein [Actinomycetota bacterium]